MFACFGCGRSQESQEKRVPMRFVGRVNRNLNWESTLPKILKVTEASQLGFDLDDTDKFELTGKV